MTRLKYTFKTDTLFKLIFTKYPDLLRKLDTEEDLKRLEALEVPDMSQAISAYRHVSATDEFKEIERLRSRARHNEAAALRNARGEERFAIARNALRKNMSIDDIVDITGLTRAEVEGLQIND